MSKHLSFGAARCFNVVFTVKGNFIVDAPINRYRTRNMVVAKQAQIGRKRPTANAYEPDTRDKIKKVAVEQLIKHGYRGLRFTDIASRVQTTRANIHYHFGTKRKLVEEVGGEYVSGTLERHRLIFLDEEAPLEEKIRRMMEFNRERYNKYNRRGGGGKPWSLIARMRPEMDLLNLRTASALRNYVVELDNCITTAVQMAKRKGELSASAPVQDIATLLAGIANSGPAITQDAGSFQRLEQLYLGFTRLLLQGYRSPTD